MKVLIADYHALLRDGLGILIKELANTVDATQCDCYAAVSDTFGRESVDLALIDLNLPGLSGLASIADLCRRFVNVPIVVMAASERWSDACAAIDAGARGYIPKSASSAIVLAALRLILSGGVYLPPLMSHPSGPVVRAAVNSHGSDPERKLTPRQMDVLRCLAHGKSNKEIAYELGLSQGTVKIHIAAIFRAFKVRNRTQAVIAAGLHA